MVHNITYNGWCAYHKCTHDHMCMCIHLWVWRMHMQVLDLHANMHVCIVVYAWHGRAWLGHNWHRLGTLVPVLVNCICYKYGVSNRPAVGPYAAQIYGPGVSRNWFVLICPPQNLAVPLRMIIFDGLFSHANPIGQHQEETVLPCTVGAQLTSHRNMRCADAASGILWQTSRGHVMQTNPKSSGDYPKTPCMAYLSVEWSSFTLNMTQMLVHIPYMEHRVSVHPWATGNSWSCLKEPCLCSWTHPPGAWEDAYPATVSPLSLPRLLSLGGNSASWFVEARI